MKFIKMLGLAAVAAAALMALVGVGSASATTLCTETASPCPTAKLLGPAVGDDNPVIDASVETSALLKTTGGATIATCTEGTVKGKVTNAGGATATVSGNIEELTWGGCNTTVNTLAPGSLEVHHISGTDNGTVTSTGAKVTIKFLGVSCVFETNATDVGTATGGNPATFDISATIPGISGGFCPSSGVWSGAYKFTTPSGTLDVVAG